MKWWSYLIFVFLLTVPLIYAAPNCAILPQGTCGGSQTEVAQLVDATGGHLAFTSSVDYQYSLCCEEAGSNVWFGHTDSGDGQGHLCMGSSCPDAIATGYDACRIAPKSAETVDEACVVGVTDSGHVADCSEEQPTGLLCTTNLITCDDPSMWGQPCSDTQTGTQWHCSSGFNNLPTGVCCDRFEYYAGPVLGCQATTACRTGTVYPPDIGNDCQFIPTQDGYYTLDPTDCVTDTEGPLESCVLIPDFDADGNDDWTAIAPQSAYTINSLATLLPTQFQSITFSNEPGVLSAPRTIFCSNLGSDGICPEDFVPTDAFGDPSLSCFPLDSDCSTFDAFECKVSTQNIDVGDTVDYALTFMDEPLPGEKCAFDSLGATGSYTGDCTDFVPYTTAARYDSAGTFQATLERASSPITYVCPEVTVSVGTETSCNDGVDNDGDLLVDYCDPDCSCPAGQSRFSCTACAACTSSPSSINTGQSSTYSLTMTGTPENSDLCTVNPGNADLQSAQTCDPGPVMSYQYDFQGTFTPEITHDDSGDIVSCNSVSVGDTCVSIDSFTHPPVFAGQTMSFQVGFTDDEIGTSWTMDYGDTTGTSGSTGSSAGTFPVGPKTYASATPSVTATVQFTDGLCIQSESVTFPVLPAPTVDVSCSSNTVTETPVPPNANPTTLTYNVVPNGYSGPISVEVLWGDATSGTYSHPSPALYTAQHVYPDNDDYTATVRVYDPSSNLIDETTCPVRVLGDPEVTWTATPTPASGIVPATITGVITVRDEQGGFSYTLNPGDGPTTLVAGATQKFATTSATSASFATIQTVPTSGSATDTDLNVETVSQDVVLTCAGVGDAASSVAQCCTGLCHDPYSNICVGDRACVQDGSTNYVCHGPTESLVDPDSDPATFATYSLDPFCSGVHVDHTSLPSVLTCQQALDVYDFQSDDAGSTLRCNSFVDDGSSYVCGDDNTAANQRETHVQYDLTAPVIALNPGTPFTATPGVYEACLANPNGCFSVDTAGNPVFNPSPLAEQCGLVDQDNDCDGLFPADQAGCTAGLTVHVRLFDDDGQSNVNGADVRIFRQATGVEWFGGITDATGTITANLPFPETYLVEVEYFDYVYDSLAPVDLAGPETVFVDLEARTCEADCTNQFGVCDSLCWGRGLCGDVANYDNQAQFPQFYYDQFLDEDGNQKYPNAPAAAAAAQDTLNACAPNVVGVDPRSPGQSALVSQVNNVRTTGLCCAVPPSSVRVEQTEIDSSSAKNLIKYSRVTTYEGQPARIVVATGK